jgi:hypothetical protein
MVGQRDGLLQRTGSRLLSGYWNRYNRPVSAPHVMGCRIACTGSGAQGFLRPNADQADRGWRSTGHADAFWQASGALYRWLFRLVGDEPSVATA